MEMNKSKCLNGHWFDADKYSVCPHCGAGKNAGDVTGEPETSMSTGEDSSERIKKKGLFWNRKEKNKESEIGTTGGVSEAARSINTVGIPYGSSVIHSVTTNPKEMPINPEGLEEHKLPNTEVLFKPVVQHADVEKNEKVPKKEEQNISTVRREIDDIKTISVYANVQGEEPVTGWLVGVRGEYRGSSFNLKAGVNVISRDAGSYICLKKDAQVSRGKHATIIYEPKKKVFYLGEGDNTMTYCNDELVCGKQELKSYDSIEVGGGLYLFVPFCGEMFDWDKAEE